MPMIGKLKLKSRREKLFGDGRPRPLDRNAKVRIMTCVRALTRRTEKGKHYGQLTAKCEKIAEALLWGFHNARSGLCFPSYEKIADRAGCARSTVAEAIKALEDCGLLSWVHRIARVKERCSDLFGHMGTRTRVIRTSNGYSFNDPKSAANRPFPSKSDFPSGTSIQESIPLIPPPTLPEIDPSTELGAALLRLQAAMQTRKAA